MEMANENRLTKEEVRAAVEAALAKHNLSGMITRKEAASTKFVTVGTLRTYDATGQGPKRLQIGCKTYYRLADFVEWIVSRSS